MEKVIDCPVCYDTDKCFEDVQPKFTSYLCFNCGFMSDSRYTIGSIELIENLKTSPKLVQDAKIEDKTRKIAWFPAVINMGPKGIIFPEGHPKEYVWKYAKVVDIPLEKRGQYDNYDRRLDIENAEEFKQSDFLEACKAMGITENMNILDA